MSINELFLKDEKRIKRLYKTALLAELLYFNYEYSSNKHDGITESDIFNSIKTDDFSNKELEKIKNDAIRLLKIKYNINVVDYEKLNFETIN